MYGFRDVNEVSEGITLPSEALNINGEYIENLIPGYRTLQVEGREALSPDVVLAETGNADGSRLKYKRYPERIITVTYQLIASSNEEFREAYNKLGGILDVTDAQLIFDDEQDKFFIGTPCAIGAVPPGRNSIVGEFEILCADPFKYSVIEYEAIPSLDESSVLIDYNGTYKAYPILEADFYTENEVSDDGETATALTGNGDCGYVAFFNEDEKIIQLGDPEESGEETYRESQTLISQMFSNPLSWGTASQTLWTANGGITLNNALYLQRGALAMDAATYKTPETVSTTGQLLKVSAPGSPVFLYEVTAKTSTRHENSISVIVTVKSSLQKASNYFGNGLGLQGGIYLGGEWHEFTIKKQTEYWRGTTGHTVSKTITVSDIDANTELLTDIKFKVERTDDNGEAGTLNETSCSNLEIVPYTAPVADTYFLTPSSYGSEVGYWHGPSITRALPADAAGDVGAVNFRLSYKHRMHLGNGSNYTLEKGAFQMWLHDANGARIVGVRIEKNAAGQNAKLTIYAGTSNKTYNYTLASAKVTSSLKNADILTNIQKEGQKVIFEIGGKRYGLNNSAIASKAVTSIMFMFEQWSATPALSANGLRTVKFVKDNCDTYKDIPNKFSSGDVVEADCKSAEIYLNGEQSPALGALGNNWEEFYLTPGLNQIGVAYSDWLSADYAPSFKVRYREVFL